MSGGVERKRMADAGHPEEGWDEASPWYQWGPYLSERAWGSVREDYSADGDAWNSFPHDHARSRAAGLARAVHSQPDDDHHLPPPERGRPDRSAAGPRRLTPAGQSSAESSTVRSAKPNSAPPSGRACAQMRPPIASMRRAHTNRPIPEPLTWRAKLGER